MVLSHSFREGAKAAVPIWIIFVPSSFAFGIAAQAEGLRLGEIVFMSAAVYSGPAQFAALEPLAAGRPALQILLASFLINLRFLPMSSALAPYFRGVRRSLLILAAHFISASSFIVSFLGYQRDQNPHREQVRWGERNLHYFLGVGMTSYSVWLVGTALGFATALSVPGGYEEGLRFILPGYFACLLVSEVRERVPGLICLITLFGAVPGALLSPDWGWLVVALIVATIGWGFESWNRAA